MFYTSKTQSYEQQNYNPNQLHENVTISQGIIVNDLALSKAIQIIEQLKQNLKYALKVNETLAFQNDQLRANAQRATKKINSDALVWQNKFRQIQNQNKQIIQLLDDAKVTLNDTESLYQESKLQVQKLNKIIYQQKKAYLQLQQNYMNQSVSYVGDTSSMNVGKAEIQYMNDLQKQIQEKQILINRLTLQIEKSEGRYNKIQKQNTQFKRWMANVLGLQKVVEGTEKILMKQIGQRMLPV